MFVQVRSRHAFLSRQDGTTASVAVSCHTKPTLRIRHHHMKTKNAGKADGTIHNLQGRIRVSCLLSNVSDNNGNDDGGTKDDVENAHDRFAEDSFTQSNDSKNVILFTVGLAHAASKDSFQMLSSAANPTLDGTEEGCNEFRIEVINLEDVDRDDDDAGLHGSHAANFTSAQKAVERGDLFETTLELAKETLQNASQTEMPGADVPNNNNNINININININNNNNNNLGARTIVTVSASPETVLSAISSQTTAAPAIVEFDITFQYALNDGTRRQSGAIAPDVNVGFAEASSSPNGWVTSTNGPRDASFLILPPINWMGTNAPLAIVDVNRIDVEGNTAHQTDVEDNDDWCVRVSRAPFAILAAPFHMFRPNSSVPTCVSALGPACIVVEDGFDSSGAHSWCFMGVESLIGTNYFAIKGNAPSSSSQPSVSTATYNVSMWCRLPTWLKRALTFTHHVCPLELRLDRLECLMQEHAQRRHLQSILTGASVWGGTCSIERPEPSYSLIRTAMWEASVGGYESPRHARGGRKDDDWCMDGGKWYSLSPVFDSRAILCSLRIANLTQSTANRDDDNDDDDDDGNDVDVHSGGVSAKPHISPSPPPPPPPTSSSSASSSSSSSCGICTYQMLRKVVNDSSDAFQSSMRYHTDGLRLNERFCLVWDARKSCDIHDDDDDERNGGSRRNDLADEQCVTLPFRNPRPCEPRLVHVTGRYIEGDHHIKFDPLCCDPDPGMGHGRFASPIHNYITEMQFLAAEPAGCVTRSIGRISSGSTDLCAHCVPCKEERILGKGGRKKINEQLKWRAWSECDHIPSAKQRAMAHMTLADSHHTRRHWVLRSGIRLAFLDPNCDALMIPGRLNLPSDTLLETIDFARSHWKTGASEPKGGNPQHPEQMDVAMFNVSLCAHTIAAIAMLVGRTLRPRPTLERVHDSDDDNDDDDDGKSKRMRVEYGDIPTAVRDDHSMATLAAVALDLNGVPVSCRAIAVTALPSTLLFITLNALIERFIADAQKRFTEFTNAPTSDVAEALTWHKSTLGTSRSRRAFQDPYISPFMLQSNAEEPCENLLDMFPSICMRLMWEPDSSGKRTIVARLFDLASLLRAPLLEPIRAMLVTLVRESLWTNPNRELVRGSRTVEDNPFDPFHEEMTRLVSVSRAMYPGHPTFGEGSSCLETQVNFPTRCFPHRLSASVCNRLCCALLWTAVGTDDDDGGGGERVVTPNKSASAEEEQEEEREKDDDSDDDVDDDEVECGAAASHDLRCDAHVARAIRGSHPATSCASALPFYTQPDVAQGVCDFLLLLRAMFVPLFASVALDVANQMQECEWIQRTRERMQFEKLYFLGKGRWCDSIGYSPMFIGPRTALRVVRQSIPRKTDVVTMLSGITNPLPEARRAILRHLVLPTLHPTYAGTWGARAAMCAWLELARVLSMRMEYSSTYRLPQDDDDDDDDEGGDADDAMLRVFAVHLDDRLSSNNTRRSASFDPELILGARFM